MVDQYIEDLSSGSTEQSTDIYFFQRLVNGVWTEYQITSSRLYGRALGVIQFSVTQASFIAGVYTVTLPVAVPTGFNIVGIMAYGTVKRATPQTGVLTAALRVLNPTGAQWIGADIADDATEYGILLTQEGGADPLGQTGTGFTVNASAGWMASDFTMDMTILYQTIPIDPPA